MSKAIQSTQRMRSAPEQIRRAILANPQRSRADIAAALGVKITAVYEQAEQLIKAGKLNRPAHVRPDLTDEAIRAAYRETGNLRDAAERLNCSFSTVQKRLKAMGVTRKGAGRPEKRGEAG